MAEENLAERDLNPERKPEPRPWAGVLVREMSFAIREGHALNWTVRATDIPRGRPLDTLAILAVFRI